MRGKHENCIYRTVKQCTDLTRRTWRPLLEVRHPLINYKHVNSKYTLYSCNYLSESNWWYLVFIDTGEIWSRLFDHRPFIQGEITFFLREFQVKSSRVLIIDSCISMREKDSNYVKDHTKVLSFSEDRLIISYMSW